jgi:hypothetical protein
MEYIGNKDFLKLPKIGFLCSNEIMASAVLKCYDWAIEQRKQGNCVVIGNENSLEKDVLYFLLSRGKQPVIVVLSKGYEAYNQIALQDHVKEGRVLIISPFDKNVEDVKPENIEIKNKIIVDLADKIVVGCLKNDKSLEKLLKESKKEYTIIRQPSKDRRKYDSNKSKTIK